MRRLNIWIRAAGGVVVLALAMGGAAGCGPKSTQGDSASPGSGGIGGVTPSASAGAGAGATSAAPSAGASAVLADGRSAAYLTALSSTKNTVTFDLIDFLTGDAAKKEWVKEHPEQPDGPDNDYMIVNNNKMLRTLPVAAGAKCVCLSVLGSTDTKSVTFSALPAFLKQQNSGGTGPDLVPLPFWLTVKNGTVTGFEEQFIP
jgi:hypothetical protein